MSAPGRARRPRSRPVIPSIRDTEASSFAPILLDFIARVPGAFGAVLVDGDGEAVDYAGRGNAYELKLAGAHWQIVLRELVALAGERSLGTPGSLAVRGERRSVIIHVLPDGYVLVLLLGRRAGFGASPRALAVCLRALALEAGWPLVVHPPTWFSILVHATRAGRPSTLRAAGGEKDRRVEILGRLAGLGAREEGWRVRLEHGAELTLVREPGGHWYSDESLPELLAGVERPSI